MDSPRSNASNDDMEVIDITTNADLDLLTSTDARRFSASTTTTNTTTTSPAQLPHHPHPRHSQRSSTISGRNRRISTISGLNDLGISTNPEQHAREQEKIKMDRRLKKFATDESNPANWMYKSFHHPVHGHRNLKKGEKAAIKIQAIFRGRHARNKFLYMYENKNVLRNLSIYLCFYFLIFLYVMFKKTAVDGYLMQFLLKDLILEEEFIPEHSHIYKNYHDVASVEEFWQFMHGPLSNGLFPADCYDQVSAMEAGKGNAPGNATNTTRLPCVGMMYSSDMLMGGVRLSTYRVKEDESCRAPEQMHSRLNDIGCFPTWSHSTPERDDNFLMSGQSVQRSKRQQQLVLNQPGLEECFKTELANSISHYFFASQQGYKFQLFGLLSETYSPNDAYICEMLYTDGHRFRDKLNALEQAEWVDARTRAVMVEFSVVNPNLGMTTSVRLFVEFLATGGIVTHYNFSTSWLFSLYPTYLVIFYWGVYICLCLFIIRYIAEEIGELNKDGCKKYCSDFINIADVVNYIGLCMVLAIDYIAQQEEKKALQQMGTSDAPQYVNYVAINYINDVGNWIQSVNIVVLTLKLFKYFRVSPKLNIMLLTISKAGSTMAYFIVIILLTVVGFAMAFYCAFNAELEGFSTIDKAVGTLLFSILGDGVDLSEIANTNRLLAPAFHFIFTFVVSILFFSLFITMVDEAYNAVKAEEANKKADITSDMLMIRIGILKRRFIKNTTKFILCLIPCSPQLYQMCCKNLCEFQTFTSTLVTWYNLQIEMLTQFTFFR